LRRDMTGGDSDDSDSDEEEEPATKRLKSDTAGGAGGSKPEAADTGLDAAGVAARAAAAAGTGKGKGKEPEVPSVEGGAKVAAKGGAKVGRCRLTVSNPC